MAVKLPGIVKQYVAASNEHDVKSVLACFLDDAVVRDEGETLHGKKAVEGWIAATIKKYKLHFKTLNVEDRDTEAVVMMEVTGIFDGSPLNVGFHFIIEDAKISSLIIKQAVR